MGTRKTIHKKRRKQKKKQKRSYEKAVGKLIVFLSICILLSIFLLESEYCGSKVNISNSSFPIDALYHEGLERPRFIIEKKENIITHTGFTLSYSEDHRVPHWVGYELTVEKTVGEHNRSNRFITDPKLQCKQAHTNDYTRSGYDRGHMAPAADMKWSAEAIAESFYLTNICPQHPNLNRRAWKQLEERVREWTLSDSLLIIVCGPLLDEKCNRIGNNKVSIPHGFFKVILSPFASPPQAIGFLFKNEQATLPLSNYAVSVDSVEVVSGLDFFHQLPDSVEQVVEAFFDKSYWRI